MRKSLLVLACLLLAGAAVVIVAAVGGSISGSQNTNSPTTSNRNENRSITPPSGAGPGQQPTPDFSKNTWELPDDADKTKNPVQATAESIAKGKELYLERMKGNCVFCHGETGSGNEANLARLRRKPADIQQGTDDGDDRRRVFWTVSKHHDHARRRASNE